MTPSRPASKKQDPVHLIQATLAELRRCYEYHKPSAQPTDFYQRIQVVVAMQDDPAVEMPEEIILQFLSNKEKGKDWIEKSPLNSIIVSCVYCLRATKALKAGVLNLAWSYVADARYWCGVSLAMMGVREAYEQTVVSTTEKASIQALSAKGEAGARAQQVPYDRLREYVYAEARKPEVRWTSRSHAARVISKKAMTYVDDEEANALAEGRKSPFPKIKSVASLKRTLEEIWLKEMPDASALFARQKPKK